MDVNTLQFKSVETGYSISMFGWRPDGRLIETTSENGTHSYLVDLDTGGETELAGTNHTGSPDGKRMAYLNFIRSTGSPLPGRYNPNIWLADADGNNAQQIGAGFGVVWSPDGKYLAFLNSFPSSTVPMFPASQVQIADAATGVVKTLIDTHELSPLMDNSTDVRWIGNLAWSPDGLMLAVSVNQPSGPMLFALDADTGAVRARWHETSEWRWLKLTWSPDSRYLAFRLGTTERDIMASTIGILNVITGEAVTLPGRDFDWSPDGKWLAVAQEPDSVFLVTPDLSALRWLDTPSCFSVAWRPSR
jgi:dipeptidyl aminopeptidase/acylaminoacyl peptidase